MSARVPRRCLCGLVLWGALLVPVLRHALEATMLRQMLVQLPLLAVAGWLAAACLPGTVTRSVARWDKSGISGLLLASLTSVVWMLPRAMDAALTDPMVTWAKLLTVPLLIGVPVALSWPRAGFVVRGVVLAEVIATALRLGWLYLISPTRLCGNYLLDDQQRLGRTLLVIGFGILVILVGRLLWGHVDVGRSDQEQVGVTP